MVLDSEIQRQMLLQMIDASQLPGSALDAVFNLKLAIVNASLSEQVGVEDTRRLKVSHLGD